jgi:hypothetical protein
MKCFSSVRLWLAPQSHSRRPVPTWQKLKDEQASLISITHYTRRSTDSLILEMALLYCWLNHSWHVRNTYWLRQTAAKPGLSSYFLGRFSIAWQLRLVAECRCFLLYLLKENVTLFFWPHPLECLATHVCPLIPAFEHEVFFFCKAVPSSSVTLKTASANVTETEGRAGLLSFRYTLSNSAFTVNIPARGDQLTRWCWKWPFCTAG